ncbi:hypothetical protein J2Z79_001985 [Symbiobacterium terraclitae]|uniref:DUF2268 domain-containing protein n=1 Tax=Symbiobacterium terraclitae TaxID=557451 RepID=A0ABS4JUG2_9FIRM|nr:hypothetical protein [Symbiobacterium terraclitae]MBP2018570.1 hypothetical protein [Symbiobacterium terraclitae]
MEVRLDPRLLTLAAALTATSTPPAAHTPPDTLTAAAGPSAAPPAELEHRLVAETRRRLAGAADHPAVQWLRAEYEQHDLLGLAMQAVQLGPPPAFDDACPDGVPPYVETYFNDVDRSALARALRSVWQDLRVGELLADQDAEWRAVTATVEGLLTDAQVEPFQRLFWGRFPYRLVVVPLWNMAARGLRGVGVASVHETYAVCLPRGAAPPEQREVLILAQHEASHPVLDDIQRLYPAVPRACAFVETDFPPAGRFAQFYGDPTFRWVETLIRASTCFYLEYLGRPDDAESFAQLEVESGVTAIRPFVSALRPWWEARRRGEAPGLDRVLPQLPAWLRSALAEYTSM